MGSEKKRSNPLSQAMVAGSAESVAQDLIACPSVVGIGASAGGLEAFEQFFRACPADSGMAFVLVSHLDPGHVSLLTEIIQRVTAMPVLEAVDQLEVEPNHVYVIPPNRDMAILHRRLQLSEPAEPRGLRMPVDFFLRSLAEDQQENAVGIIFSGTGSDGTLGLRAVFGAGGVTLAQEPSSAKYDGMPSSAIKSGYVTHVLPAEKMPAALQACARRLAVPPETPPEPTLAGGLNHILMQLRTMTGHDFSLYKKSTVGRRIARRMSLHTIDDADVYIRFLKKNPAEVRLLFKELLINVTSFFRDPDAFVLLQKKILPELLKGQSGDFVFRVWVAGCATGEEAYSIAILLRELMDEARQAFKVQIYSTDLADEAIALARAGLYPLNIAQDVSRERLQRFFVREEGGYRIKKEVREMIVFAVQNVIKDPPFTRLDLLCCRNLMIYLEPELQNRLLVAFHYALKPGGVLFLSPSESIGNHTELFSSIDRKWKLYRTNPSLKTSSAVMARGAAGITEGGGKIPGEGVRKVSETNFVELTRRVLVQYFAPASVVTDLKGDIFYVHGDTGKYLRPAPGQASLNVIEMARDGLATELHAAISAAAAEGRPTLDRPVQLESDGKRVELGLSVRLLPGTEGRPSLLLVSFQDRVPAAAGPARRRRSRQAEPGRIEELERDLAYLRESYQTTIEEQQASQEELKSINEEMQSTNEELQSTNEELETSKEELQSVNEELITVNAELQAKIEQLSGMQNDMKNLLENVSVGIIFLDRHLSIRSFTRDAMRIYRLAASDIGRPLNDIKSRVHELDLLEAAAGVLDSLVPFEREICLNGDTWMLVRIQPYRTLDNVIDGVLMTFTDITARLKSVAVQEALTLADGIVQTIREPLIVLDGALKVVFASQSFYDIFRVGPEETVGRLIYQLGDGAWNINALRQLLESTWVGGQEFSDYPVEHDFPGVGYKKIGLNARRFIGKTGEPQWVLLSMQVTP
jgi:two-component system CheB/CheR fusion protein